MPWDFWLIFLMLTVILPWRGRVRVRRLLAKPQIDTIERLILYASTIAMQWVLVGVVIWRAWAHGFSTLDLGLALQRPSKTIITALLGAAMVGTLQWFNLRRVAKLKATNTSLLRALAGRILPQSKLELLPYSALAITAGLCEEFLYRGFVMATLTRAGLPLWSVVLLSSALFGLAHLYQGPGGFVSTLAIGTVFGIARIEYDSLIPVMAWHAAVDIVAGIAGPKYLIGSPQAASGIEAEP